MLVCTLVKHLRTYASACPQQLCPLSVPAVQKGSLHGHWPAKSESSRVSLSQGKAVTGPHAGFMFNNTLSTPQKGSRRWQLFSHFLRVLKWVLFLGMSMCGRLVFWAQKIHLFLSCKNVFFMPNRYWFLKYLAFSSGTDSLKKKIWMLLWASDL